MQTEVNFSSKRFLLTLMLCACSVILLQNYDLSADSSFTFRLVCVFAGLAVCLLLFVPAIILKKRSDSDLLTLARGRSSSFSNFLAVIYSLYFLYTAAYFLLPYTDMFCKKYYSDTSPCVISFFLIAGCVYAAFKGVNVITRFGIFLFAFAMLTNILMCGGSLSSLNFAQNSFAFRGGINDLFIDVNYFITPSFIAVLFVCLSGYTHNFKIRQIVLSLFITGIKFASILFFVWFAVGAYATRQEYQTFVLSRVAHFGRFVGIESFLIGLATMSVFMIISLLLCCMCRSFKQNGSLPHIIGFSAVIFIIHLFAAYNQSIAAILTNPLIFNILNVIAAFVIPIVCMITERRGHREKA